MPEDMKEDIITSMQEGMAYVIKKAEEQGFLFELITQWPKRKIAVYEAAVTLEKSILEDNENKKGRQWR
jgi:hypothetical protein